MNDERIIAYLLEELSPEESARFEEECFDAETWPAEVRLVEDELIEDYLRGELSPERRQRFRLNYLTTAARRERVGVAAALLRHADEAAPSEVFAGEAERMEPPPAVPTPLPSFLDSLRGFWGGHVWAARALAALLVVAVVVVVWLMSRPDAPGDHLARTLTASRSERAAGARAETVSLGGHGELELSLVLPEGEAAAPSYRVELEDEKGSVKTFGPATPDDGRKVKVVVDASQLARGAYVLKLYALDGGGPRRVGGSYFLNVE